MIRNLKYSFYIFLLLIFTNCSFDNKTGIWDGSKKEKKRLSELQRKQKDKIDIVKIYSSTNTYSTEVKALKNISLNNPKENTSWKMSHLNLQNNSGNLYLSGLNDSFLKKKIGKNKFSLSNLISSPLITNKNIFYSDDTGTIFSVNEYGKIRWKKNIYKKRYKKIYKNLTFSISNNIIYVADNIGFIYCMNINTGELIWIKKHGVPLKSNIKIYNKKIFLINQDNRLLSFDTLTGSQIWDLRSVPSFIKSQNYLGLAISKNGDLVILTSTGDLLKVDADSGSVYWIVNTTASSYEQSTDFFISSDIVISENDIIFSTHSSIYSFNLDTGYLNWQVEVSSKSTPIVVSNNVFIVSDNGYFLNVDKKNGKIIWATDVFKILKEKKRKTIVSGFLLASNKVYITTLNGYLIVSSGFSGKVESFIKIGDKILTSPVISNGALYILTENSRILGFR